MTKRAKTMTENEFMEFLGPGEPIEVLKARQAEDVALAMAEREMPLEDMVRIRIVPGRPPTGSTCPTQGSQDAGGLLGADGSCGQKLWAQSSCGHARSVDKMDNRTSHVSWLKLHFIQRHNRFIQLEQLMATMVSPA
jgi:hypothetical protein